MSGAHGYTRHEEGNADPTLSLGINPSQILLMDDFDSKKIISIF
jgi:hypothetical protein